MQDIAQWAQPVVTVVSLAFGGGVLYGDVQEVKKAVEDNDKLEKQVVVMEQRLATAEEAQRATVIVLSKMTDTLNKLNNTVIKLEAKLEDK